MTPALRKLTLTTHVASSVGWLGAVASVLALSLAGLTGRDPDVVRAVYPAMNLIGRFIIVPLSIAALVTGVIQSVSTHWGLLRYYWVATKLALTVGATGLLLLHQYTAVATAARRASAAAPGSLPDVGGLATQLVLDAGLAVAVLVVTTALSIYKPWGRIQQARLRFIPAAIAVLVALVVILRHLMGGGLGHQG